MNHWQKWIAYFLVMALPVTGFASLSFEPHCDRHAQENYPLIGQDTTAHCAQEVELTQNIQQFSPSEDCQCECNDHLACVGGGTATVAITGLSKILIANSGDVLIHYTSTRISSVNLSTIFRPPISNS